MKKHQLIALLMVLLILLLGMLYAVAPMVSSIEAQILYATLPIVSIFIAFLIFVSSLYLFARRSIGRLFGW